MIRNKTLLKSKGPFMLASNHPNSFLDAIIYDVLFDTPIYSLARGDVFKKKWAAAILHKLKIFPVYRTREGTENLQDNYKTFDACLEIFKRGGATLIFSEGLCINEWHLRPLKKGTARLAIKSWETGIPLKVIPIGINYSAFRRFGKKIDINIGVPITQNDVDITQPDGNRNTQFNKILWERLQPLVYAIEKGDTLQLQQSFHIKKHSLKETLFLIPSLLGAVCNAPLYYFSKWVTKKLCNNNDHYDSMMLALLLLAYPFYLLLFSGTVYAITLSAWSWLSIIILPLLALAYTKRKIRLDKAFA